MAMRRDEQHRGDEDRPDLRPAAPQDEADRGIVDADPERVLRLTGLVDRAADSIDEEVREDGDDRQRHDQRRQQRERDRQRERQEELADEAAGEPERQEDGHGRECARGDRAGDLARPLDHGRQPIVAERPMAIDVLEDDDRVVDDAADRDGEPAEGQDVQRDAGRTA